MAFRADPFRCAARWEPRTGWSEIVDVDIDRLLSLEVNAGSLRSRSAVKRLQSSLAPRSNLERHSGGDEFTDRRANTP
jgi:hypothetical protein